MKRTLSALLIGTLVLASITACGKESDNKGSKTPKSSTEKHITTVASKNPTTQALAAMPTAENEPSATESTSGASFAEQFMSEPIVDRQIIDQTNKDVIALMDSYKSILKNESTFFDTYAGENKYLNQPFAPSDDEVTLKAEEFAIIDLDGNGFPEVVLNMSINGHEHIIFRILSFHENQVYGYAVGYRGFCCLKTDGTFNFSGSAAQMGIGSISSFSAGSLSTKDIAYRNNIGGTELNMIYTMNGQSISEETFDKVLQHQSNKPDVIWHNCSDENIEKYFSL